MRKILKTSAAALAITSMTANICAAAEQPADCAYPADVYAVRAAAVQQNLMVAALTCHAIQNYNRFVVRYRTELRASDHQLEVFFLRIFDQSGTANYHSFKTRLANASSLQSIGSQSYCTDAQAKFDAVLSPHKKSLTIFLSGQPAQAENTFTPCEIITASTKRAPGSR